MNAFRANGSAHEILHATILQAYGINEEDVCEAETNTMSLVNCKYCVFDCLGLVAEGFNFHFYHLLDLNDLLKEWKD